jgi:hypothetical protein
MQVWVPWEDRCLRSGFSVVTASKLLVPYPVSRIFFRVFDENAKPLSRQRRDMSHNDPGNLSTSAQ